MTLSWNEIRDRALKFSNEWAETYNEDADVAYEAYRMEFLFTLYEKYKTD